MKELGVKIDEYPCVSSSFLQQEVARWLVAEVSLHKRSIECVTGGDFGFVIIRPQITFHSNHFKIDKDYQRGLLCQAKLKDRRGCWGRLTPNQRATLPKHLEYAGLLLYSYSDDARRKLNQFQWQICSSATLKSMIKWLRDDAFPGRVNSDSIIQGLGQGTIGTADKKKLAKFVSPKGNASLVITLTWPKDKRPKSEIRVFAQNEQRIVQQIKNIIRS